MTDFIHEAPPPEGEKPSVPEKPVNERERQKRVYVYIAVLFTAAFILILWSFLSTHRSNQQVIDQLKGSTNLMQSTLERNAELEDEVKALEGEVDELEKTIAAQSDALASYEEAAERNAAALRAMDWLAEIERAYSAKSYEQARENIRAFEDSDLAQYLSDAALHTDASGDDAPSPAERYGEIVAKLFPNGVD